MTRLAGQTRAVEHEMEALAGIVKLGLTAVFDAQHGGVATGWSPVFWGLIDELFVNLTMPVQQAQAVPARRRPHPASTAAPRTTSSLRLVRRRTVQKRDRGVDGRSCITLLTESRRATSHRAAGGPGRDHGVAVPSTAAGSGDC